MLQSYKKFRIIFPAIILCATLSGWASELVTIYKTPPKKYEKLGRVSGSATGSLGAVATAYYAIPMDLTLALKELMRML